jgi:hypothetical protein
MERRKGFYAILQYSPVPERFEFVNFGVVLVVPEDRYIGIRFSKSQKRIEKLFGRQSKVFLDALKAGLEKRLRLEFAKASNLEHLISFAQKRANSIRISEFLPIAVEAPEADLSDLFDSLVGDDPVVDRAPRVTTKLREELRKAGIFHYVDEHPDPVDLPEHGVTVSAPFGYQNGSYNLVDAMRLGADSGNALKEAGKRAIEGQLLASHYANKVDRKRLVVVGDFARQRDEFYRTISDLMEQHKVRLYRLDDLAPLLNDIEKNGRLHATA